MNPFELLARLRAYFRENRNYIGEMIALAGIGFLEALFAIALFVGVHRIRELGCATFSMLLKGSAPC